MLKTRTQAVANVTSALLPAEQANDQSGAAAARCLATMLDARIAVGMSICENHQAVELIMAALTASIDNRQRFITAHAMLRQVPQKIGLGGWFETNYGDNGCPEGNEPRGEIDLEVAALRAVG